MHTRTVSINKPWKPGRSDIITGQLQWFGRQEEKQIWIESKRKVPRGDYWGTLERFKRLHNILSFRSYHDPICVDVFCCHVSVQLLFSCLHQIRHAAANVLRECWLLHRTNLKRGNRGEHRRHQRCLLEAIRVWVIASLHKRLGHLACVGLRLNQRCKRVAAHGCRVSCV